MIYTSYFSSKKYDPENAVAITAWTPKWWKGKVYQKLAPPFDLLWNYKNGYVNEEEYKEWFIRAKLDKLNPYEVYHELDNKVLLCFEKTGDFCHRHIVAEWLQKNGYECEEL